jgi:hypothetical protein
VITGSETTVVEACVVLTELLSGMVVFVSAAVITVVGTVVNTVVGAAVVILSGSSTVLPQAVKEKIIIRTQIKTFNFFIFYSIENIPYFILSRLNLSVIGLLIKKSRIPVVMP